MTLRGKPILTWGTGKGEEWLGLGDVDVGKVIPEHGWTLKVFEKGDYRKIAFPEGGGRCGDPEPRRKDKVGGRIDVWIQRDFCSLATANMSGGLCLLSSLGNEKGIILCVGESWQACSLERMDKIIDNIVKSLGEWEAGSWAALRAWSMVQEPALNGVQSHQSAQGHYLTLKRFKKFWLTFLSGT